MEAVHLTMAIGAYGCEYEFVRHMNDPGWKKGVCPVRETAVLGTEEGTLYVNRERPDFRGRLECVRRIMKREMVGGSMLLLILFAICAVIYCITDISRMETLTITLGVTSYHFIMRLSVGGVIDRYLNNRVDYTKKWFEVSSFETYFYNILKVKKWKQYLPTLRNDYFDRKLHSLEEIASATCQAEIVHEIIAVLSFMPVILSKWLGSCGVFVITSLIAALIDSSFVMIQRFNRPRLLKVIKRLKEVEAR